MSRHEANEPGLARAVIRDTKTKDKCLNTSVIRSSIANRNLIEFSYHGYPRIAEPHVYGIKNGKRQILIYQVGGLTSTGKVPDWRRINLDEVIGLKVSVNQTFAGPRANKSTDYDDWDTIIAAVK